MNYSAFRFMDTEDLAERIEKLERKVEGLKQSTTKRLLEQCQAELAEVQAEQRRRATRES